MVRGLTEDVSLAYPIYTTAASPSTTYLEQTVVPETTRGCKCVLDGLSEWD